MNTHLYDVNTMIYIGLSEDEATTKLQEDGWRVRTTARDGEDIIITLEVDFGRANLEVKNGKVIQISVG